MKHILFLLFIGISITANSQRLFDEKDSVVNHDGRVFYSHTKGFLKGTKRVGEWKVFQYSTADTNKRLAWEASYEKGKLLSQKYYSLDGYTLTEFKNGQVKREARYRYGKIVSERIYSSKKTAISKTYYSDGIVSGEGTVVLVEIIAGCDSGMQNFQKYGVWKYYDQSGNRLDDLTHNLNEFVFKKL